MNDDDLQFRVTDSHVALLRHAYVRWENIEWGAPAIDGKRPYGNGDIYTDMLKILGQPVPDWDDISDETRADLMRLHHETETALQIVLRTGSLKAGLYERPSPYGVDWREMNEPF